MSRRNIWMTAGLALTMILASCSEQGTAPTSTRLDDSGTAQLVSSLPLAPSSPGWQATARGLVATNRLSPLAAARVYAALSIAQYRAVVATTDMDDDGQIPESGVGAGGRSAIEAHRGAVAGASAQVLSFFFPSAASSLEAQVVAEGEVTPGDVHPEFTRALAIGRVAGQGVVDECKLDGFTKPWTGTVPTGPGMWIANGVPAGGTFGEVKPWLMMTGSQFRPAPPPAWLSPEFEAAIAEIRTLSDTRTPEQLAQALYWNFPTGTYTPPGYFNEVAGTYIAAYGLDERAATRAFAVMHAAMMDALIGCWDAKFFYWTLRPSQADPAITMPYALPNHPSYPSGHSCQSAAAATVLTALFPDRASELNDWVTAAGLSRMYGGIHYRFDITAGNAIGRDAARWALAHADLLR